MPTEININTPTAILHATREKETPGKEQIKYYLENNKKMSAPTNKEKYEIIKEHLELNLKEKGNVVGINEMRKHISAYTKNMPEASRFRDEINHITDVNILMSKIQEFFIDIFDKK